MRQPSPRTAAAPSTADEADPRAPAKALACAGLAAVLPVVVEVDKWIRRRSQPTTVSAVPEVVAPTRAAVPAR